jgi:general secretion pathway protein G
MQNTNSLSGGNGEITVAQLAQRSLVYLRKFFPRVVFSTSGTVPTTATRWYDFNGNGGKGPDTPYILEGHQCLVFFLGGIPVENPIGSGNFSVTGFGKDPTNPFSNSLFVDVNYGNGTGPSPMYSANRTAPLFEFNSARLATDPLNPYSGGLLNLNPPQIPGYLDSLGNSRPDGAPNDPVNFYAYFSAYGSGGYDPNDINFSSEVDAAMQIAGLSFRVGFPVVGGGLCGSPAPNPYTSTVTVPPTGVIGFINPQSFQIISSGGDGLYGLGGQYLPDSTNATLPLDSSNNYGSYLNTSDHTIRTRERDNLTNFHNGKLE